MMSACHLSCAVTVLDTREADLVKYLNWFVDLVICTSNGWEVKETEKERVLQFIVYLL